MNGVYPWTILKRFQQLAYLHITRILLKLHDILCHYIDIGGKRWRSWLRHGATTRKVAGRGCHWNF